MTLPDSRMRREIQQIPNAVDRLLHLGADDMARAARVAATVDPALIVTVARGSSDHVCTYLKYAAELTLGLPVASIGPSVASVYGARLRLGRAVSLSVSQSGQSPDIVQMTAQARRDGACTLAMTNDPLSPMARAAERVIDIHAGPETSVAATKTFVTSAVAGLMLIAEWRGDDDLRAALHQLPQVLARAVAVQWPDMRGAAVGAGSVFTLGRGPSWAMSNEAALKFKETCQIHAESYSSAEILHGPVSIVGAGFPVLCFAAGDAAEASVAATADDLAAKGAHVFVTSDLARRAGRLDHVRSAHPLCDPVSLIASFYGMVEQVAVARGLDPDTPRHLNKVTQTR